MNIRNPSLLTPVNCIDSIEMSSSVKTSNGVNIGL